MVLYLLWILHIQDPVHGEHLGEIKALGREDGDGFGAGRATAETAAAASGPGGGCQQTGQLPSGPQQDETDTGCMFTTRVFTFFSSKRLEACCLSLGTFFLQFYRVVQLAFVKKLASFHWINVMAELFFKCILTSKSADRIKNWLRE